MMRLAPPALFLGALLAPPAPAQGGYRTQELPSLGIELPVPRDYDAVPVEPTERWVVAQWIEQPPRDEDDAKAYRPKLQIVWIDWVPDAPSSTGDAQGGEAPPESFEKPPPPINSFDRYLERYYRAGENPFWAIGPAEEEDDDHDGYDRSFHALLPTREGPLRGWAAVFRNGRRTIAFFGTCLEEDLKDHAKIWERMADKAEFTEPEGVDLSKWERFYAKRDEFVGPEYRLDVRSRLVRGWEAVDTENFIIVYSTKDEVLIRILQKELEAIREEYLKLFPPAQAVTVVSTVRVCRDRDEYLAYGGSPWSGGYWNSAAEELVFYDYEDRDGDRGSGKEDTRIVLYHEAFHQYVHYSTGELPPHSWFNEGTGDYYSGALIRSGKVKKIDVNPWRTALVQDALEKRRTIPWKDIVGFEQAEFYRPDRRSVCYAQAWSMVYFLLTSKAVAERPEWAKIHPIYFDTLKTVYAEELAKLTGDDGAEDEDGDDGGANDEPAPAPDPGQKLAAGLAAREAALKAAFEGVDFDEIEAAWREYTLELKPPKR